MQNVEKWLKNKIRIAAIFGWREQSPQHFPDYKSHNLMMLHYKYDLKILITMELTNDNHLDNFVVVTVLETLQKYALQNVCHFDRRLIESFRVSINK